MPDTAAHPLRLGFFPEPRADDLAALVRRVRVADEAGLDVVGVQDTLTNVASWMLSHCWHILQR